MFSELRRHHSIEEALPVLFFENIEEFKIQN
jgi:hypothetical protein